jgi:hypothetical protein
MYSTSSFGVSDKTTSAAPPTSWYAQHICTHANTLPMESLLSAS